MKKVALIVLLTLSVFTLNAQEVSIDGRLKPFLDNFFELCDKYEIEYHEKLFNLKKIAIVENLKTSPDGSVLGMVQRDADGNVDTIAINWIAMLDSEILKVIAFHEFGHYFLEYSEHVCNDCEIIMARINSSYFKISNNWDEQLKILFEKSPAYLKNQEIISETTF